MKTMLFSLAALFISSNAFATVDGHSKVYLVVRDIQSDEFFIERAPIIACYGMAGGAQLVQFTAEYKVNSNMGCGGETFQDNINYLTCAKVVSSEQTPDSMGVSKITLDISNCDAKEDSKFITMVRMAAKLNFPLETGEVKLTLIK